METFKELGVTDVHLVLQYGADTDDTVFFTVVDGELAFDCTAQEAAAEDEAAASE